MKVYLPLHYPCRSHWPTSLLDNTKNIYSILRTEHNWTFPHSCICIIISKTAPHLCAPIGGNMLQIRVWSHLFLKVFIWLFNVISVCYFNKVLYFIFMANKTIDLQKNACWTFDADHGNCFEASGSALLEYCTTLKNKVVQLRQSVPRTMMSKYLPWAQGQHDAAEWE